ncbi:unnamed protein product, partial [Didymodactylos carnosus]
IEAQQKDPEIQKKISEVQENPNKYPYVLEHGVFYKLLSRDSGRTKTKLIYLPKPMIAPALRSCHGHPLAGHFGLHRTYDKMKYKYWWPNMQQTIHDYINSCPNCNQHNYSRKKKPGHLYPIPPQQGPFQMIGIDYCGPLMLTPSGNRYVLCITDHFSKRVTAVPLLNCTAQTTAETILTEYICKFGVPTVILLDNGTHFQNQLMSALMYLLGHNHIYSTTYHPQTNGTIERFNATFVPQLAKLQDQESNNWDDFLPAVIFAYNTGQHFSTKFSPFQLQYGQIPKLPPDQNPKTLAFNKPCDYYHQLQKNLKTYHKYARGNMIHLQQLSKQRYDRNRTDPHYQIGDLVLTRYYGRKHKLIETFSRTPSRIIEVEDPIYWVEDVEMKAMTRVHVNDLRLVLQKQK